MPELKLKAPLNSQDTRSCWNLWKQENPPDGWDENKPGRSLARYCVAVEADGPTHFYRPVAVGFRKFFIMGHALNQTWTQKEGICFKPDLDPKRRDML